MRHPESLLQQGFLPLSIHAMNGKQAVFRIAIASALFCFLIFINRELARVVLVLGPLAAGLIALWNNDKPWARRCLQVLNKPKSWWQ